jgi:hypothetical protein
MKLTLLILSLFIVAGSFLAASAALAKEDSRTDFCTLRIDSCFAQCAQYNFSIGSTSFPSPRSVACGLECSLAYAGCLMMRFREGV